MLSLIKFYYICINFKIINMKTIFKTNLILILLIVFSSCSSYKNQTYSQTNKYSTKFREMQNDFQIEEELDYTESRYDNRT